MTIYRTLLERGYLPKELPPQFGSASFARYANTRAGRALLINGYTPPNRYTETTHHELALTDPLVALVALHMRKAGMLPTNFQSSAWAGVAKRADADGADWLLLYEAWHHGYSTVNASVSGNSVFAAMHASDVSFYDENPPAYAAVVQPGGAPEWLVKRWIRKGDRTSTGSAIEQSVRAAAAKVRKSAHDDEIIGQLLGHVDLDATDDAGEGDESRYA